MYSKQISTKVWVCVCERETKHPKQHYRLTGAFAMLCACKSSIFNKHKQIGCCGAVVLFAYIYLCYFFSHTRNPFVVFVFFWSSFGWKMCTHTNIQTHAHKKGMCVWWWCLSYGSVLIYVFWWHHLMFVFCVERKIEVFKCFVKCICHCILKTLYITHFAWAAAATGRHKIIFSLSLPFAFPLSLLPGEAVIRSHLLCFAISLWM